MGRPRKMSAPQEEEDVLDFEEARTKLNMSENMFRALVKSDALPVIWRGKRRYFALSELNAYLVNEREEAKAKADSARADRERWKAQAETKLRIA